MAFPPQLVPRELDVTVRTRGYLPHWEAPAATYFLTFRLADSLPRFIIERLERDRRSIERQVTRGLRQLTALERLRIGRYLFRHLDDALDEGHGQCLLARDDVAAIVQNALLFFHGTRYEMFAWCVMPSHVHALFRVESGKLDGVLHSWKSYTCHEINRVLGRRGQLWEREYYDRIVRNERHFLAVRRYILNNPEKAGLHGWKWRGERLPG